MANKFAGKLVTAYHTGVQIGEDEYSYCNDGEVSHSPKEIQSDTCVFIETIEIGEIRIDKTREARNKLKSERFVAGKYDPLTNNCNHFSEALLTCLFEDYEMPDYINKAAKIGAGVYDIFGFLKSKKVQEASKTEEKQVAPKKKKELTPEEAEKIKKMKDAVSKEKAKKEAVKENEQN